MITNDNITFKKITEKDLDFITKVRNQCVEFLHTPFQFTREEVSAWFKKTHSSRVPWYIIYLNETSIGYIRTSEVGDKTYIGMDLHENYRGKGYSQRAYKEFIPWLYIMTGKDELWLEVLKTNERAIHIYEKLGFKKQGEKKINRNGQKEISLIYKHDRNAS